MFVRGQVSGAVVPGLDLCKVNAQARRSQSEPSLWLPGLLPCGYPWWRGNPWPPGRRKGSLLALKPQATKIQNEFLQPWLGRHARERESSRSRDLTAISPFQSRAWGQRSEGIGPSQGISQPSCLQAAVLWNEQRPALARDQRLVPEGSQRSLLGGLWGQFQRSPESSFLP